MITKSTVRSFSLTACIALFGAATVWARPVPANLGNGLDKLVASDLAINTAKASGIQLRNTVNVNGNAYTDQATASIASNTLSDSNGRVLVRITLNGTATAKEVRAAIQAAHPSVNVNALDEKYRGVGVMNAYVNVSEVAQLAQMHGVAAVILEWRPRHAEAVRSPVVGPAKDPKATVGEVMTKLGTDFDQGVTQHRVDQINQYYNPSASMDLEGQTMQIACISNSYAAHTAKPASTDVTNFDLPGASGNPVNTMPVFVLLDDLSSTSSDDEGRGMCQIAYKMAPKARIGFGTADTGEVGFANVIRGLAGVNSSDFPNASTDGFVADTECDDVGYFDEPFYQDGIIADGVDDASAAGTAYFSSAANDIGTNGYSSPLRWVANGTGLTAGTNSALAGTNINLANVPSAFYAGGFHNFNPAPGQLDVAQTVNDPSNGTTPTVLQWNEPYDQTASPNNEVLIWTQNGNYTSSASGDSGAITYTITPSLTAGTIYELDEIANGDGFDGAITVYDPSGNVVVPRQDNAVDEVVRFSAPVTGTGYTVVVGHFSTTTGAFTLNLYSTTGFTGNTVQTQIRLLVFDTSGNYLPNSSGVTDATATDEPLQLVLTTPTSGSQVQYVIARANVPTPGPNVADQVRYLIPGNGAGGLGPAEYFTYASVTTGGHATAATCNGCAAYSVFRPSLPEYFTSPGPATIYYDKSNNRLSTPEVRMQPHIATADAANVSSNMNNYFAGDSGSDPDTNGNFSGTSAAGPHAAAIGALVLQVHGGARSITPAQMTTLLENSTFPHDLDPDFAMGTARVTGGGAGKVTITINSDNASTTNVGLNDPNSFTVSYVGGSSVTSLVFNPGGTSATAGNPTGGNNGVTYSTSPTTVGGTVTYFENSLPGVAFFPITKAFTLGSGVTGATAAFTNLSGSTNQYYTMTLTIPSGNLSGGNLLHFTVGRGLARASSTGGTFGSVTSATAGSLYSVADIFGGNPSLPNGTTATATTGVGMTFSGTTADGGVFTGTINNRIGNGYSVLDGYGFINAQAAVNAPVQ